MFALNLLSDKGPVISDKKPDILFAMEPEPVRPFSCSNKNLGPSLPSEEEEGEEEA